MNGCAPSLALIERLKATRKWAIGAPFDSLIHIEVQVTTGNESDWLIRSVTLIML